MEQLLGLIYDGEFECVGGKGMGLRARVGFFMGSGYVKIRRSIDGESADQSCERVQC